MNSPNLGRLEQIELRNIWANEAGDFTPWLAQEENLRLLGDTIGMELELVKQEQAVGPFSADIFCRDTAGGTGVLIENQLERTDHTHLGQLITYAAGLQAVNIVWIASRLTEEHRAALDWLNEITSGDFRFFGLEIEVWKIGDSIAAPKFNIVSKPNDWVRDITRSAGRSELSDGQKTQLDFWTEFKRYCSSQETFIQNVTPKPQSWHDFSLGRTGFHLVGIASFFDSVNNTWANGELRTEFYLDGINCNAYYQALKERREEIESGLGRSLIWSERDNARTRQLKTRREADLNDRTSWTEYCTWLLNELNAFEEYFRPIVSKLQLPES